MRDEFENEDPTTELLLTERDRDMHALAAVSAAAQRERVTERNARAVESR